jgi:hypothetical protein
MINVGPQKCSDRYFVCFLMLSVNKYLDKSTNEPINNADVMFGLSGKHSAECELFYSILFIFSFKGISINKLLDCNLALLADTQVMLLAAFRISLPFLSLLSTV